MDYYLNAPSYRFFFISYALIKYGCLFTFYNFVQFMTPAIMPRSYTVNGVFFMYILCYNVSRKRRDEDVTCIDEDVDFICSNGIHVYIRYDRLFY